MVSRQSPKRIKLTIRLLDQLYQGLDELEAEAEDTEESVTAESGEGPAGSLTEDLAEDPEDDPDEI